MEHHPSNQVGRIDNSPENNSYTKYERALLDFAIDNMEEAIAQIAKVHGQQIGKKSDDTMRSSLEKPPSDNDVSEQLDDALSLLFLIIKVVNGTVQPENRGFETLNERLTEHNDLESSDGEK